MANPEHLSILEQGVEEWNQWRDRNPETPIDLRGALLDDVDLHQANLEGKCDLTHAFFHDANLGEARLSGATLVGTNFCRAHLCRANLVGANLTRANLDLADLTEADLSDAILERAILVGATVTQATFTGCRVYGVSAWDLNLAEVKDQSNLRITRENEPGQVTVDNLEVAQFVYLLLNNKKIRDVIDTITSKVVLILGRFTSERKAILDEIREKLRSLEYVPVIFDFDKPGSKDLTGTIETLARMARFIIADLTDPSSIPHELATIVPLLRTTPVAPLRLVGSVGYSMFDDYQRSYSWVLPTVNYNTSHELIASLTEKVITPAEAKAKELTRRGNGQT